MVEFYKKELWSSFAELNATHKDLYDSVGSTMVNRVFKVDGSSGTQTKYGFSSIRGGQQHKKAIFKTKVADRPVFGSGDIKRMDAYAYIEDVVLESYSTTTPNLVLYKCKPDVVDYTGAGHLKLAPNATKQPGHLTAITANQGGYISDEEKFTGLASKFEYAGNVEYIPIARSLVQISKPFLEVGDAHDHVVRLSRGGELKMTMSYNKFSRRHCSYTETTGKKSGRRKVCFIMRADNLSVEGDSYWKTVTNSKSSSVKYFRDSAIAGLIQGIGQDTLDSSKEYNNQVTPDNSFFSVVQQDKEMLVNGTDDKSHLVGTAVSRFSTKNTLKGNGQSMEMYCYWAGATDINSLVGADGQFSNMYEMYSPSNNPNPNAYPKIQQTMASYGPIPFPALNFPSWFQNKYFTGDITANTAANENRGANVAGTIELDINLDGLDIVQAYDDSLDKISLVKRGFLVTLGFFKPTASDNILSYMGKHFTTDGTEWGGFSDTNPLQTTATSGFPFLGWAFNRFAAIEQLDSNNESDWDADTKMWTDGVHMQNLSSAHTYYNSNSGHGSCNTCTGNGRTDVYVKGDQSSDAASYTATQASSNPVPNGYFTMKIMFPAAGDQWSDAECEVQLCDPKTGIPLRKANEAPQAADKFSRVSHLTHHMGYTQTYWWSGRTANAGALGNSSTGLGFPHSGTDDGGVSYFASDHSSPLNTAYGGGPEHAGAVWPRFLTVWLTNFHNSTGNGVNEDMMMEYGGGNIERTQIAQSDGTTATDTIRRATQSSVFVDGVRLKNFNYTYQNATTNPEKHNPTELLIDAPSLVPMFSTSAADAWAAVPGDGLGFPGYTVLSFGTDEVDDFVDGGSPDVGIFLNNFSTNLSNNQAVTFTRWAFTTGYSTDEAKAYSTSGTFPTSQQANNQLSGGGSYFGNQMAYSSIGGFNIDHSKTYAIDTNVSNTNALGYTSGTGSVDGFTRAGFIRIKGDIQAAATGVGYSSGTVDTVPVLTKRENIACSARVLKVVSRNEGVYKVDSVEPFKNHENDTFIGFLWGGKVRNTTGGELQDTDTEGGDGNTMNNTIKLIEVIDNKHVKLEWNGLSKTGEQMTSEYQLPYLFISPYKYWVYGVIQNWSYSASAQSIVLMPAKTYSSALCTIGDGTSNNHYGAAFGATWNEYLYNDAPSITGSYENSWTHDPDDDDTILDIRDYGFGTYEEETETGGFISKSIPKSRAYNQFKMPKIFEVDSTIEPGDDVHFVLDSLDPDSKHEVIFYNNLSSAPSGVTLNDNQTDRLPYSLTVFEDKLPETPSLSVVPYENDPYLPEFRFSADDDDLWYGFMIIDSKPVNTQYHDAILHLPLNDAGSHGEHPSTVPVNKAFKNNTDGGTTTETAGMSDSGQLHDIEGLAGNCMRFDGNNDFVKYNPSSGDTLQQLTSEASWVAHFVTDNGAAGVNYIIESPQCDLLIDADTGIITTHVYSAASEFVTLTSPAITMDGETPCNAIVTFDKNLKSGNVKLYIDGKLVDQSGLVTAAGPSDGQKPNWDKGDDLHSSTGDFTVGRSTTSFDGRIEEVVVYKKCIYPVAPSDEKFVLTKNLTELSNGSPVSYSARLFMKDYHNIRGGSSTDVATSPTVSYRKAAFRLVD